MVKIEQEDLLDRPISKDCVIYISFRMSQNRYNIDFESVVDEVIWEELEIDTVEGNRVVVRAGNRMWFKRPRIALTKVRNAIQSHLEREYMKDPEDAIQEAVDMTGTSVYSMAGYNRAELGVEFTLDVSVDETAMEPVVIRQFLKSSGMMNLFNDIQHPEDEKFQVTGLTTKISSEELDRHIEELKDNVPTTNEMLFCIPEQ